MQKFTIENHTIKIKFLRFLQIFAEMVRNYADLWSIAHHKQIMIQHYKACKCKCLYISIYQYLIENGEYDKNLVRNMINCTPQANHKTTLYKPRNTHHSYITKRHQTHFVIHLFIHDHHGLADTCSIFAGMFADRVPWRTLEVWSSWGISHFLIHSQKISDQILGWLIDCSSQNS